MQRQSYQVAQSKSKIASLSLTDVRLQRRNRWRGTLKDGKGAAVRTEGRRQSQYS
jgi:hypothetical protein